MTDVELIKKEVLMQSFRKFDNLNSYWVIFTFDCRPFISAYWLQIDFREHCKFSQARICILIRDPAFPPHIA